MIAWDFVGDVREPGGSEITDFRWKHQQACPDLPFASYDYPEHATVGAAPPADFDDVGSAADRLAYATAHHETPFSVDVDKLTDEEIDSLCLTVEDCHVPPQLTVVRHAADGAIWQPRLNSFRRSFNDVGTYCCDVNQEASKQAMDTNFFTLHRLPPAAVTRAREYASKVSQSFFPRGSDATTARIIKVSFEIGKEPLYIYVDMTCGAARDYYRRNGFLGQWKARLNGLFYEIVYRTSGKFPSTHGPARNDLGFVSTKEAYADYDSRLSLSEYNLALMGVIDTSSSQRRFAWITVRNIWSYLGSLSPAQMVAAYVKTGLEWTFLSPPKGNMPVALLYLLAAQNLYSSKMRPGQELDFSVVARYSGAFYDKEKPALDYLAELQADGRPRFMQVALAGTECIARLPKRFVSRYINDGVAPEVGCFEMTRSGAELLCAKWCSSHCSSFWGILAAARATIWDTLQSQVPRCSDCPGFVGVIREDVPYFSSSPFLNFSFFPQCIPFRAPNGELILDQHVGDPLYEPDYDKCETCSGSPSDCVLTDA